MRLSFASSSLLLLATVLACAAADDLAVLKTTLQKLCDANEDGKFGSCCRASNNGQDITAVKGIPTCFGSTTITAGSVVQKLFVSHAMSFLFE